MVCTVALGCAACHGIDQNAELPVELAHTDAVTGVQPEPRTVNTGAWARRKCTECQSNEGTFLGCLRYYRN